MTALVAMMEKSRAESYGSPIGDPRLSRMYAEDWGRALSEEFPVEMVFIAMRDGEIVGFAAGGWRSGGRYGRDDARLRALYVLKSSQRQGIGSALLERFARAMANAGARTLYLSALRDDLDARAFYERLGGRRTGKSKDALNGKKVATVLYRWTGLSNLLDPP
jgi:GNAT superfamily N-acetyltransferase